MGQRTGEVKLEKCPKNLDFTCPKSYLESHEKIQEFEAKWAS